MTAAFLTSAFAANGAPVVKDFPTPLRDFAADGKVDSKDKHPFDPDR